jgi:Arc/MetJ-type ribon-helix-helix transcriptional regulator
LVIPEVLVSTSKIAITLDEEILKRLDQLVDEKRFPSRSRAIQEAVKEKLDRMDRTRLLRESAKLDPEFEQQMADEGLREDIEEWPEY